MRMFQNAHLHAGDKNLNNLYLLSKTFHQAKCHLNQENEILNWRGGSNMGVYGRVYEGYTRGIQGVYEGHTRVYTNDCK